MKWQWLRRRRCGGDGDDYDVDGECSSSTWWEWWEPVVVV
jgi:hypothetical protein